MKRGRKSYNNNNKKGRGKRRGGGRRTESSVITVPIKFGKTFTYAAATTQNEIALNVNGTNGFDTTTRFYDIALAFSVFKVVQLAATIYPFADTTTADNTFALAYLPSADNTGTADAFAFSQLQNVSSLALVPALKTMPTTLTVGRNFMTSTIQKWYITSGATNTYNDDTQGTIIIKPRASSTCTIVIELSMLVQFKIPTTDSLSGFYRPKLKVDQSSVVEEVLSEDKESVIVKRFKSVPPSLTM